MTLYPTIAPHMQPGTMSELCLALVFKMQLCRFIPKLLDADIERIASSLCAPPIRIPRPIHGEMQLLTLDPHQVRGLLDAAAAIYSYEKAKRAASMVHDGSGSIHQSCACSCICCEHLQRSTGTTSLSPAAMARSHMHQRIDDCPLVTMKLITEEIMLLNPSWDVNGLGAMDKGSPQEEMEVVVRLLLHRLVDLVNYEKKDEEEEEKGKGAQCKCKESEFDYVYDRESASSSFAEQVLSELWCHMRSEEELREWVWSQADPTTQLLSADLEISASVAHYCFRGVVSGIRLDALIWMLLIKLRPHDQQQLYDSLQSMFSKLQLFAKAIIEYCGYLSHKRLDKLLEGDQKISDTMKIIFSSKAKMAIAERRQHDREVFLQSSPLHPPRIMRLIDLEATGREGMVCLVDYYELSDHDRSAGFTAVSHTFGMDVYQTFDCHCTSKWASDCSSTSYSSVQPRWKVGERCAHGEAEATSYKKQKRDKVVADVLRMCQILKEAGARYAWHDGVCIAQHDEEEVKDTIERIGWVFAYAAETVIFLHYVGNPISFITMMEGPWERLDRRARWHERACTFQEGVLSKRRRYCVRIPPSEVEDLAKCSSLEDFEQMVERWYDSNDIQVLDEDTLLDMVFRMNEALCQHFGAHLRELQGLIAIWRPLLGPLLGFSGQQQHAEFENDPHLETLELLYPKICTAIKASKQLVGMYSIKGRIPFDFPTATQALGVVCQRDVKHEGDRMNSILALYGVTGFVAPKDEDLQRSTVEFFRRRTDPQSGLQTALYAINFLVTDDVPGKRWIPCLRKDLILFETFSTIPEKQTHLAYEVVGSELHFRVTGKLVCLKVEFEVQNTADEHNNTAGVDRKSARDDALQKFQDCETLLLDLYSNPSSAVVDPMRVARTEKEYDDAFEEYVTVASAASASAAPGGLLWEEYMNVYKAYYSRLPDASLHQKNILRGTRGISERALHPVEMVNAIECEQESSAIRMKLRPFIRGENYFEALWPGSKAPRCSFGVMASPYLWKRTTRFSAYLTWPRAAAEAEEVKDGAYWPMLVVEGDLKGSVEKVGVFTSTPLFRACVRRLMASATPYGNDTLLFSDSLIIN